MAPPMVATGIPSQSSPSLQVISAAEVQPPYFLPRYSATSFIFRTLVGNSCGSVCRPQAISSPEPVLAATEAFGCTSSKDSENTFISVPVAFWNAATIALNASSSAGTKRFQRITVSLAPFSACHGADCAQALAYSSRAGPVNAAAAVSAVPPLRTVRRVKSCIVVSPLRLFGCSGVEPLTRRLVEQMNERGIWFKPDFIARIELMAFAEYRDHLLAAELGEHLGFRPRRFHHHDL